MNAIEKQLTALRGERDQARDAALALVSSEDYDPTSDALKGLEERAVNLDGQIERLVNLMNAQNAADALDGKMSRSATRVEERDAAPESNDWGSLFVKSEQYREYNFRGTSHKLEIETRALPHSLASMADALPSSPVYDLTSAAPSNLILPLVTVVPVTTNSIDYITWSKSGAAAVVAEGTLKPSIEWTPDVTSASLDTVAAHTSFTRQLAEDSNAVRSFLTNELQGEVRRQVEALAVSSLGAASIAATGTSSTLLGAIRKGKSLVEANGFVPNAFLVHPDDIVDLDVAVMTTAGTAPNQTNSYWGLRPVVDTAGIVAPGEVIVGDFKKAVNHYARNSVALYLTDSHGDNFRYNILDAIAETRSKTVVVHSDALASVTVSA